MTLAQTDCLVCKTRNCSILKDCETATLTSISNYKHTGVLKKGEKLFSECDPVQGVHFIKRGFLKIELNGKQGRPLVLKFAGKGSVFGHRANAEHPLHSCSVVAASEVFYCFIPQYLFQEIYKNSPVLKQQILDQILNELELAEKKAIQLAHRTVKEKVAEALLMIADVYGYEKNKQSFRISFCRQDIADFAGTTKEQVSKVLKDFEKEKLIKCTAKKFNYIDITALEAIRAAHTLNEI